jgi:GDP-L-fucose synthase
MNSPLSVSDLCRSVSSEPQRVLLTGGGGMLGRALIRKAVGRSAIQLIAPNRADYDLTDRSAVRSMYAQIRPDVVIHAAAKVGGIQANVSQPYDFLTENILLNTHVIEEARRTEVPRLIFVGSSCMYPKDYRSPLIEEDILAASLEPTNEGYALSKIVGARACEYISREYEYTYRTLIPCNLYGPGDTFDPGRSHLIAAIVGKVAEALRLQLQSVEIWGDGEARREFLFVDDLADFILAVLPDIAALPPMLNVGALSDHTVNEYYRMVSKALGYHGAFTHNLDRPVGMRQKLMDSQRAVALGWHPVTAIHDGIQLTVQNYLRG